MRYTSLFLLLLILLTSVVSWVGSIYDWGLHNLLDAEGVRWSLTHVLENFRQSPWVEVVLGLSVLGLCAESGLPQVCTPRFWQRSRRSLKKLRALQITSLILVLLLLLALYFVITPSSPLLSAFGHFFRSPLYNGLYSLILLTLTLLSIVYGGLSGRFLSLFDIVLAITCLPARMGGYFVSLFIASQLIACIHYMLGAPLLTLGQLLMGDTADTAGIPLSIDILLHVLLYGIPLFFSLFTNYVKR